jgi:hypothetical protein
VIQELLIVEVIDRAVVKGGEPRWLRGRFGREVGRGMALEPTWLGAWRLGRRLEPGVDKTVGGARGRMRGWQGS